MKKIGSWLTVLARHWLQSPRRRGSPGSRGQLCWQLPPAFCSGSSPAASSGAPRVPRASWGQERDTCVSPLSSLRCRGCAPRGGSRGLLAAGWNQSRSCWYGAQGNHANAVALAGRGGRETLVSGVSKPESTSPLLLMVAHTKGEKRRIPVLQVNIQKV